MGGTFTDAVCFDAASGAVSVHKLPSTPPEFQLAVIETVERFARMKRVAQVVHGSTVATNALLTRSGRPCAFVTTAGFEDMLLIGRQNRPELYALRVERPAPITPEENWFAVRERIDSRGEIVESLAESEIDGLIDRSKARGLKDVAVCLLFSFANPVHEEMIGRRCEAAGLTVSLSSRVLPEFREYERASTTAINAALRPPVENYLRKLAPAVSKITDDLRIMHSGGGTLTVNDAAASAARLVLSGPAGGVIGAAMMAKVAGIRDVITYDMGGTSTDVATIIDASPQWTTSSSIDGLPLGLATLDIQTVGAGGGSIAHLDAGGALRVGPASAGAIPGPACYGRGGTEPTVTDANVVLGRILPDHFAGGAMRIDSERAHAAIESLAKKLNRSVIETALGITRVAENNMGHAVRAITSRRGVDPRGFALLSFGGAGGLHACAVAESLDIPRVVAPPFCGVLSALGMVVAPPVADAARTVVHMGAILDNDRMAAEFGSLSAQTMDVISYDDTASVQPLADVRFEGQSHELTVLLKQPLRDHIETEFKRLYEQRYGQLPMARAIQIVTLRVRRIGKVQELVLPKLTFDASADLGAIPMTGPEGKPITARAMGRGAMIARGELAGPLLLIDAQATTFIAPGWRASASDNGMVLLTRSA